MLDNGQIQKFSNTHCTVMQSEPLEVIIYLVTILVVGTDLESV
jgi:hypothetical protein